MWPRLICLCAALLLTIPVSVQARPIPYCRMDSLLLSEAVVLCEEQSVTTRPVGQASWHLTATRVRCRVVQAFKGRLAPGAEFEVEYDPLYYRVLPGGEGGIYLDSKGKVERVVEQQNLPPGRARCSSCSGRQRLRCAGRWSVPSSSRASRSTSSASSAATPAVSSWPRKSPRTFA